MDIQPVIKNVSLELNEWGKVHLIKMRNKELAKYFVRKVYSFFKFRTLPYEITWRTGLLAKALIHEMPIIDEKENVWNSIEIYFREYFIKKGECQQLENIYNGEACIEMYKKTKDSRYLGIINQYIDFLMKSRKDAEGSLPYFTEGYDILTDGLMCCHFIFSYVKNTKNDKNI